MADKNVVIYSTPTCPYCKRAKDYLSQKGIPYTDYNVATDKDKIREMIQKSGQMGVPVIAVDDEIIIGFNQAKLDELLSK
jgi:glutaredoxin-like YruB-family protein